MPTYEYRCAEGHDFERVQKMSEDPIDSCPECGAAARRMLSAGAGFLFKGDGFYITDYRSDDYRKAAKSEEKAATPAASSDGGTGKGEGSPSDGPAAAKAPSPDKAAEKKPTGPPPSAPATPRK